MARGAGAGVLMWEGAVAAGLMRVVGVAGASRTMAAAGVAARLLEAGVVVVVRG